MKRLISLQNPLIKHLVRLRKDKRYRQEHGSILITGEKLIFELAKVIQPIQIYIEESYCATEFRNQVVVSYEILKKITGLPSPDFLAAEFPHPLPSTFPKINNLLVLDRISDPGNLGTLLRSAVAFNWDGVFFLPECADPFSDKVLRSSRGALFQLPWQEGSFEDLKGLIRKHNLTPLIADIEGTSFKACLPIKNPLLLLSHEGAGPSKTSGELGQKITIPMDGPMESLNVAVAGSILMFGINYA